MYLCASKHNYKCSVVYTVIRFYVFSKDLLPVSSVKGFWGSFFDVRFFCPGE